MQNVMKKTIKSKKKEPSKHEDFKINIYIHVYITLIKLFVRTPLMH